MVAPVPSRVQPSRINRSNRMADIMANIEDDDDSRTAVPRRKKRSIIESDPDDMFTVPEEIESNAMAPAPVKKKRRQINVVNPKHNIPPLLPLQLASPAQIPPNFQPNPGPKPHDALRSQYPSESRAQPQESSKQQSHLAVTFNPINPSGIRVDEDDPMDEGYEDRLMRGWFYF